MTGNAKNEARKLVIMTSLLYKPGIRQGKITQRKHEFAEKSFEHSSMPTRGSLIKTKKKIITISCLIIRALKNEMKESC